MNALDVLVAEHSLIHQYLSCLAVAVDKLERGERPPREFFEQTVLFARNFVDKHHHFKEEHQTFVALAQAKGGQLDGPLGALRHQHEHGRNHIKAIADAIPGYAEGRESDGVALLEHLAAYLALLRQHINREDHVFYPLVREALTDQEHAQLAQEFRRVDDAAGDSFVPEYRERVLKMEALLTRAV